MRAHSFPWSKVKSVKERLFSKENFDDGKKQLQKQEEENHFLDHLHSFSSIENEGLIGFEIDGCMLFCLRFFPFFHT